MKVLVIDDEKDMRENISSILKKNGYKPVTTDNVKDAEDLIRTKKWDLIISDVMIPHLGGFELVDLIKEVSPKTPVIVITGMDKDILGVTLTDADTVLTKPFTSKQLSDAVGKLTRQSIKSEV
ncbi:MAG TPA: response regulator [Bacteroidia bacterium]|nr:response regulator [Bacteroidia bacterium]